MNPLRATWNVLEAPLNDDTAGPIAGKHVAFLSARPATRRLKEFPRNTSLASLGLRYSPSTYPVRFPSCPGTSARMESSAKPTITQPCSQPQELQRVHRGCPRRKTQFLDGGLLFRLAKARNAVLPNNRRQRGQRDGFELARTSILGEWLGCLCELWSLKGSCFPHHSLGASQRFLQRLGSEAMGSRCRSPIDPNFRTRPLSLHSG